MNRPVHARGPKSRIGGPTRLNNSRTHGSTVAVFSSGFPGGAAGRLAVAVAVALTGCGSSAHLDPGLSTPLCAAPTTTRSAPFPVQFRLVNDSAAPLFLQVGCIGVDLGISSCASGFREALGPSYHCGCSCNQPSCTGQVSCGPCPQPTGRSVAPGEAESVDWGGLVATDEMRGTFSCVRSRALPAGRYRIALEVYDTAEAAASGVGGRTVARDFDLPAASDAFDVSLAAQPGDTCDPGTGASGPACTGAEAHDVACDLPTGFDYASDGGLSLWTDASHVTPAATYTRVTTHYDGTPDVTCTAPIPRCSRDARVVTTGDLTRALTNPAAASAFAANMPVFGSDYRPADGSILVVSRPDGTSVGIGGRCDSCPRPLPAALAELATVIVRFDQQMRATPTCAPPAP